MTEIYNHENVPHSKSHIKGAFLALLLFILNTTPTTAYAKIDGDKDSTEVNDKKPSQINDNEPTGTNYSDIIKSYISKLPASYQDTIYDFLTNNPEMKDNKTKEFIIKFVEDEMKSDRQGIDKTTQLSILWEGIYEIFTGKAIYDKNENGIRRAKRKATQGKFRRLYTKALNERNTNADQEIITSEKNTKKIKEERMKLDSIRIGNNLIEFYETYTRNPNIVKQEELDTMKKRTRVVVEECNELGINYRDLLLKMLGDEKKVDAILKLYGIDTPTQSAHNLENNISNTLGIANDIQKIYNLCVNGSIITPEQKDYIQQRMEELKENGIDCVDILKGLAKKEGTNIDPVLDNLVA